MNEIGQYAERYFAAIVDLIQNPTSNLVATALGLAIVVLVFILIVLALLAWALSGQRGRGGRGAGYRRAVPPPTVSAVTPRTWATVTLLGIATIAVTYGMTSTNDYCATVCHTMVGPAQTWESSAHAEVPCTRCHEGKLVISFPNAVAQRLRSAYLEVTAATASGIVLTNLRCLGCHQEIREGVVVGRGVVVSHAEILDAGADCFDCHGAQGHTQLETVVGMSACLTCHNGEDASAECATCHPDGPEAAIEFAEALPGAPVALPLRPSCEGCHSLASCDACHGLRMPHPVDYEDPRLHAAPGAFSGKERICWGCHVESDCERCHGTFLAHGENWNLEHRQYPRNETWCSACHDEPVPFCDLCH